METCYKRTCNLLKEYINTKGPTALSNLSVNEYNVLAKENNLLNTYSINYISGLNWRNFKNKLIKEYNQERKEAQYYIKQAEKIIKKNNNGGFKAWIRKILKRKK